MTRPDVAAKRAREREAQRPTKAEASADVRRATDLLMRAEQCRKYARQLEAEANTMTVEATVLLVLHRRPVGDV